MILIFYYVYRCRTKSPKFTEGKNTHHCPFDKEMMRKFLLKKLSKMTMGPGSEDCISLNKNYHKRVFFPGNQVISYECTAVFSMKVLLYVRLYFLFFYR